MLVSDLKTVICNKEGMWLGSSPGQWGTEHENVKTLYKVSGRML